MSALETEVATCRGCRRELSGKPYYMGGSATVPETGERALTNFYGGYVCSRGCDFRASLEHEQTMPGHNWDQSRLGTFAQQSLDRNWGAA